MKASELRIDNWLMGNKPFQMDAIGISLAYWHEKKTGKPRWEPIPLTEEWLLKFGFKREGVLTMRLDKFTCCCEEDCIDNFCLGDIDLYDVVPKYVHQLQNLYFALIGEELTIKS